MAPPAGADGSPASQEVVLAEVGRVLDLLPDWYPARKGAVHSVFLGRMHYIRNDGDGREELYDRANDPDELRDLSKEATDQLPQYRAHLKQAGSRR